MWLRSPNSKRKCFLSGSNNNYIIWNLLYSVKLSSIVILFPCPPYTMYVNILLLFCLLFFGFFLLHCVLVYKLAVYYRSHVLYKLYKIIFFTKVTKKLINQKKIGEIKNNTYKHQLLHHPFYSKVFPFVVNRVFWCWSSNRLHVINREQNGVKRQHDINMQHANLLQIKLLPKPWLGER